MVKREEDAKCGAGHFSEAEGADDVEGSLKRVSSEALESVTDGTESETKRTKTS